MSRSHLFLLLLALPVFVLSELLTGWIGSFLERPLAVATAAVPLALGSWVLWRLVEHDRSVLLGPRFLAFLLAFCLLFAILASTDVLTWQRTLVGFEETLPRNWLGLGRLGDWHYLFLPEAPAATDLLVITLPGDAPEGELRLRPDLRRELAGMIAQAARVRAKGVALDYYLENTSVADPLLCAAIGRAEAAGVPVFVGYRHVETNELIVRRPLATNLEPCFGPGRRGHLAGYVESDSKVRYVPLLLRRDATLPSLSLLVARHLAGGEVARPRNDLLQVLEPRGGIAVLDHLPTREELELYRDRFLFVGTASANDALPTPFGTRQGVVVHAAAVHALRSGHWVRRLELPWAFPSIFGLCYLLIWLQARRGGWRALLASAALLSAGVVAAAAAAARFSRLWIDVAYPLVALWSLVGLLLVAGRAPGLLRAHRARRAASAPVPGTPASGFDVFLSHNSSDKPAVRELCETLRERGLHPWLDEDELAPGQPWQEGLEQALAAVRSAAVIVGPQGLGPWEVPEMRVCLMKAVERQMPIIPVLLPGTPRKPELPLFLMLYTWVDLREGLSEKGLDRLVWGITGVKPKRAG